MTHNISKNKAFSLIELSIVILVIGILIAGITQSSSLYLKYKLQAGQNLTKNSPVNGIKDLAIWYETSLAESIDSNDAIDGNRVYTWHDVNPQRTSKNDANNISSFIYPATCATCPTYVANGINGLPVIYFNYNNSARLALSDSSALYSTDLTIFAVGFKGNSTNASYNVFIGSESNNPYFFLGYQSSTGHLIRFVTASGSGNTYSGASLNQTVLLLTAQLSKANGKKTWMFGSSTASCTNSSDNTLLSAASYGQLYLARGLSTNQSDMNIAELIVFQRELTTEERQSVEKYLSQKYAISVRQMPAITC